MKKPSVTIYLRPNKSKDRAAVNARYIYDRQSFPIPLGFSISLSDWDARRQRVNFSVAGSAEVNAKINETVAVLESIANAMLQAGNAPAVDVVKAAYQIHLKEIKEVERKAEINKVGDEFKADITSIFLENSISSLNSLLEKVDKHKKVINELKVHGQSVLHLVKPELLEETNFVNQEFKIQFLGLLQEYIEEKTGVGLDASAEEVRTVKRATTGTNKGLRSWAKALKGFTESKHVKRANLEISIGNLSQKFYDTYAAYLMDSDGHNLYNNSFGGHVKKLKTFLKWVELDKQLTVDRRYLRFKVLTEEKEIVKLSMTEIDLLYTFDPDSDPNLARVHGDANSWRKYIDFTVFSFLTSLRISDIKRVKGFRIENGYIQGRTKKTNGNFKIPLNLDPRIMEILERYGRDMRLFSDVEYNRQIKKLLKMFLERHALYQQPLSIRRFKYTEPEPIETSHYFYELYTSHCNRKGWVSQMSDRGFDDFTLMEMMGTKSHQEFLKYKKNKVSHLEEKVKRVLETR